MVESDRVNPKTFYAYAAGKFYASTDGGATFVGHGGRAAGEGSVHLKAVPGAAGEVWLAGQHRRCSRSTDSGGTLHQGLRR